MNIEYKTKMKISHHPRYPVNESMLASDVTYLSYQTLTIDLYAPLLMLILLFSLMYTLMSCSCSRISDRLEHIMTILNITISSLTQIQTGLEIQQGQL